MVYINHSQGATFKVEPGPGKEGGLGDDQTYAKHQSCFLRD